MKRTYLLAPLILLLAFIAAFGRFAVTTARETSPADELASKILRFHVIANSDSEADQQLKLLVKERLVSYIEELTTDCADVEEVKAVVTEYEDAIRKLALEVIQEQGYTYSVTVSLTNAYFPVKVYGDLAFPSGYYDALKVEIGSAQGKNWWCVLYPPLCFVDVSSGVVPNSSKEELSRLVGEETYSDLLQARDNGTLKIKSKLWESVKNLLDFSH